jgi:RNA polymerase-binding transcription factor DksA
MIDPGAACGVECAPERPARPECAFIPRLEELRRRSVATVAAGDAELATLADRESGESEDDAPRLLAVGVLSGVLAREWRELEEIAAARRRLADGTFGRCEACGEEIDPRRLRAMPAARFCVACQKETET